MVIPLFQSDTTNKLALKKARANLREHNAEGWDGKGSKTRSSKMAGVIKWESNASQNKYPSWKRKQLKLREKIKNLKDK